mmetsp:Transcript_43700/g.101979  ORF Transcript_43700/g.101979 Transcript_43700/m.101979 type:complete len:172 (-) Transcript_43700:132-647(-)
MTFAGSCGSSSQEIAADFSDSTSSANEHWGGNARQESATSASGSAYTCNAGGICNPCVFFGTRAGCHREACPYCHLHTAQEADPQHHQRPRKNARARLKRTLEGLLESHATSPEQIHDQLQAWTARSHYARNVLTGYFEKQAELQDNDEYEDCVLRADMLEDLLLGKVISL